MITIPVQDSEEISNIVLPAERGLADGCMVPEVDLSLNPSGAQESLDSSWPRHMLYRGNVELGIAPPPDDARMEILLKELKVYGIELRNIVASSADQSTIDLFLKTPIDLVAVLESVDGVIICGGSNNKSQLHGPEKLNIQLKPKD